jgi:hypothetical protein
VVGDIVQVQKRIGFAPNAGLERFVILAELGEFVAVAPIEPAAPFEGFSLAVQISRGKRVVLLVQLACVPATKFGEKVGEITPEELGPIRDTIALMFDL